MFAVNFAEECHTNNGVRGKKEGTEGVECGVTGLYSLRVRSKSECILKKKKRGWKD